MKGDEVGRGSKDLSRRKTSCLGRTVSEGTLFFNCWTIVRTGDSETGGRLTPSRVSLPSWEGSNEFWGVGVNSPDPLTYTPRPRDVPRGPPQDWSSWSDHDVTGRREPLSRVTPTRYARVSVSGCTKRPESP